MYLTGGLLFYSAGLALAPYLYDHDLFRVAPFLFAGFALLCKSRYLFPVTIALCMFSFGLNQYFLANLIDPEDRRAIVATSNRPIIIEGEIKTINSRPDNAASIDIDSVWLFYDQKETRLTSKIRISVEQMNEPLLPGDTIRLQTRLKEQRNFKTPGAFNYKRYLLRRDIVATGFALKSSNIARIHSEKSWNPATALKVWRSQIRQQVNDALTPETAPFVNALAIGDRGAMSISQRKLLAESGLAHLFAISGLHLGLVASLLYLGSRSIYLRSFASRLGIPARRLLPPLLLPLLYGYMILTGSAISTVRALIMLAAVTILCVVSRRTRPIDVLVAAAFLILATDPLALFEPSFQLSIAGAGGIILLLPIWQPYLEKTPSIVRYALTLFAVTLSASLATMPFVLLHFHTLAPAGLLLNLLAVPLVSLLLVPLTLVAVILTLINPAASTFCFQLISAIMVPFTQFVEKCLSIDLLSARTVFMAPSTLIFFSTLALFAVSLKYIRQRTIIATTALFISLALTTVPGITKDDELTVYALDVGQGDATILQMPSGKNYLIDGGGLYSERFDTGERLVAPTLGYLGIDQLDAVILSHDHPDHRKGLAYLLRNFPVKAFWSSTPETGIHPSLLKPIQEKQIPTRQFQPGWQQANNESNLDVFVPGNTSTRLNDHSLVLYARHGSDGLILTGDLEKTGIEELAASSVPGPVTLLKLPHHGSRRSDPSMLLNKYRPKLAFSSIGTNNRYGLPHSTVLATLTNASVPLQRTDRDGTIRLTSKGQGWAITHWKKGLFR
jgi:competence protein ComEC